MPGRGRDKNGRVALDMMMWALVRGGLGNQMFQAAHALALGEHYGVQPRLVEAHLRERVKRRWELDCFNLRPHDAEWWMQAAVQAGVRVSQKLLAVGLPSLPGFFLEQRAADKAPPSTAPSVLSGYFQGERFFKAAEPTIRKVFRFPPIPHGPAAQGSDGGVPIVAMHVRRGDYVSDPIARRAHLVCDADWYGAAWRHMKERVGNCSLRVFSDDPDWASNELGLEGDVYYVEDQASAPAWVDMARMSLCDHFVISNSSYSWWAAYLAKSPAKTVIAPREWFPGVSTDSLLICPPSWVLM